MEWIGRDRVLARRFIIENRIKKQKIFFRGKYLVAVSRILDSKSLAENKGDIRKGLIPNIV